MRLPEVLKRKNPNPLGSEVLACYGNRTMRNIAKPLTVADLPPFFLDRSYTQQLSSRLESDVEQTKRFQEYGLDITPHLIAWLENNGLSNGDFKCTQLKDMLGRVIAGVPHVKYRELRKTDLYELSDGERTSYHVFPQGNFIVIDTKPRTAIPLDESDSVFASEKGYKDAHRLALNAFEMKQFVEALLLGLVDHKKQMDERFYPFVMSGVTYYATKFVEATLGFPLEFVADRDYINIWSTDILPVLKEHAITTLFEDTSFGVNSTAERHKVRLAA